MRISTLFLLILVHLSICSQVTFVLDSIPAYTPEEDIIYIAGDFNGWNAGDVNHQLQKNNEGKWETSLDGFADGVTIQYKFTRGSWETVEKGINGEEINNRSFTFGNDSTVHCIIYNWAIANSTAAENVIILDENFYMPQLDRTRRIWVYLPPDYDESESDYPVLYMHDGQNLFDQLTAFSSEWEVDETLNKLFSEGYRVPIVVGIDHGGVYRIDELTPWFNAEYGGGQGDEYMAFIVETLKPYIDATYRTLTGRDNTGIMGSSLGGLISTYGAVKYQEVYGKAGSFSPAYWINSDSIWGFISENGMMEEIRFYQNIGELEEANAVDMMHQMEDSLKAVGFTNVISNEIIGGEHNELTWRNDFRNAYLWLFNLYANDIRETNNEPLLISPNPVADYLKISHTEINNFKGAYYQIVDTSGKIIFNSHLVDESIHLKGLMPGIYVIILEADNMKYSGRFIKN